MKKIYVSPEMEVSIYEVADVITVSGDSEPIKIEAASNDTGLAVQTATVLNIWG